MRQLRLAGSVLGSFGLLIISALLLPAAPAGAATSKTALSMTTSPVSVNEVVSPGSSKTTTLQIMNNGTAPLPITMRVDTFSAYGTNGQAAIHPPASDDPSTQWVRFSRPTFVAQPGVWTSVKMTISLPAGAQLGYYYAVIFSPTFDIQPQAPGTNVIKGSNAILVLVNTKSGNENYHLHLADFSSDHHIYEYLPATINLSVANAGNIYAAPTGDVYISRSSNFGKILATLPVNPGQGNVLPHSSRLFHLSWTDGFPAFRDKKIDGQVVTNASGKPVEQLAWDYSKINKLRIGKYYAKAVLVYSNGTRDIAETQVISFWILPWKLILGAVVVLVLLVAGAWTLGRNIVRVRGFARRVRNYRRR